jgi:O6-methylguanine-DNA--protein-cysteine methyltransferase
MESRKMWMLKFTLTSWHHVTTRGIIKRKFVRSLTTTFQLDFIHHSTQIMARGERSEEVWAWYEAVYEAIQEIPFGKVTSYGHIARLVGKREHLHRLQT